MPKVTLIDLKVFVIEGQARNLIERARIRYHLIKKIATIIITIEDNTKESLEWALSELLIDLYLLENMADQLHGIDEDIYQVIQ